MYRIFFPTSFLLASLLSIVGMDSPAMEPLSPLDEFLHRAIDYRESLEPTIRRYRSQVDACRQSVDLMGAAYDAILTTETGRVRDTLIASYERDRPAVVAEMVNLDTATRNIQRRLDEARDFLHHESYAPYRSLASYRGLDDLLRSGYEAWADVRNIPRPRPLPSPLPTAVQVAEVVEVRYATADLTVGKTYSVQVEVKSNCHYTERTSRVEIRVLSGPAKISGELMRSIKLGPGQSELMSWEFTPTAPGLFRIGARIVKDRIGD